MKPNIKRTTVYLDSDLHHALRIKAAETEHSMSELVQEAIKISLAEDSIDLAAFEQRKKESSLPFEDVLKKLGKNGKI
ncbi:MAG: ribbon-helix-helix protein, CopG family [Sedimentisphaerales bacterium]|nr:ribbon-helix-helix protein, CopG family [Sedimentisphaerales bacterium]